MTNATGAPTSLVPATTVSTATVSTTTVSTTTIPATITLPPDPIQEMVTEMVAGMTLEEKIGQLLMPVLAGTDATEVSPAEAAFNQRLAGADSPGEAVIGNHLGGVLYLGPNVVDADQLGRFSSGLQGVTTNGVGLLIAVDQEGGRVNRVLTGVDVQPSARSLAGDPAAVTASAAVTAEQLSALGVNVVLAPVADVTDNVEGVIGDRSYGGDPRVVAEMVVAAIEGLQSNDVAAAAKHWPGHGSTSTDSHQQLAVLDLDSATWAGRERIPFEAAVDAGVDIVMVGHLALPALDPSGDPATVSPILLDQLLRDDLGFDGVVMTDALDMGAVGSFDPGELAVRSILAGADVLLVPTDLAAAAAAISTAIEQGRLTMDRLDESVHRILTLKGRLGLLTIE